MCVDPLLLEAVDVDLDGVVDELVDLEPAELENELHQGITHVVPDGDEQLVGSQIVIGE